MGPRPVSRRALLRGSAGVCALLSTTGCVTDVSPTRRHTKIVMTTRPVLPAVADREGPVLYATALNSPEELRRRVDWRAFKTNLASDTARPPDVFRAVDFDDSCLTALTTQFSLRPMWRSDDSRGVSPLPVSFDRLGGPCTYRLELPSPPNLLVRDADTGTRRYMTWVSDWAMEGWPTPSTATINLSVTTAG